MIGYTSITARSANDVKKDEMIYKIKKGMQKMSSTYSPWIYRKLLYKIPFLFKKCFAGNYHWFFDQFCFCCENEHFAIGDEYPGQNGEWHGGIRHFKTGIEYIRYRPQEYDLHHTRCDACGDIIWDDENNVGYECDLHERCAHE